MMKIVDLLYRVSAQKNRLSENKKDKASEQSGSLMIEAIALLGLMSIMSPMVVRQTSDRTTEMEDAVLAGQMKTLKDALKNYLEVNYETITSNAGSTDWSGGTSGEVSIGDITPFLPASFLSSDNKLRGNKFLDDNGYKFGYHGDCTKTIQKSGLSDGSYVYGSGTACTTPGGATECQCMNWNLTGLVLSSNGSEIPDKRVSRIAQMVGSDGGFVPTANYKAGFGIDDNSVVGSQGMWQIDQVSNFGLPGAATGGQLAAITGYAGGTQGDYLYRRKVNGIPDANSMFTDLDMGGNGQCDENSADGQCSRIHSAGGVEVVDGRLIVRQKHVDVGNWNEEDDATNEHIISLGLTNAVMAVNTAINMTAANSVGLVMDNNGAEISMLSDGDKGLFISNDESRLGFGNNTEFTLDNNGITSDTDKNVVVRAGTAILMNAGTGSMFRMYNNDFVQLNTNNAITINTHETSLNFTDGAVDLYANNMVTVRSNNAIELDAQNRISIGTGNSTAFSGSGIILDKNGWLNFGGGTGVGPYASNTAYNTAYTQIVGGLVINTSANSALLFSQNPDSGTSPVVISDKGISMHRSSDFSRGAGQANYYSKADVTLLADNNVGGRFMLGSHQSSAGMYHEPPIEMRGDSGLIFASQFVPKFAVEARDAADNHLLDNRAYDNNSGASITLSAIVNTQKRFAFDPSTGVLGTETTVASGTNTFNMNIEMVEDSTNHIRYSYNAHQGGKNGVDASNLRFKVDPAFESVMNDIRLTSRGGARLSEILPNYIIKGIYELSNTYYKGPWPCVANSASNNYDPDGSAHCTFTLRNPTDLPNMEKPYSCNDYSPADVSSGVCSNLAGDGGITIDLYNGTYLECNASTDGDCDRIAHPYLGVVPAPGRGVTDNTNNMGTMTGYDEGPCPDGYTPNVIFTPARFEVGKVLHAVSRYDYTEPMMVSGEEVGEEAWIAKNYDKNRWSRTDTPESGDFATSTEGLFQPSTQMEYATKKIVKNGVIIGWQVAMGTYSQVGSDFVWNYGATTRIGDMFGYATTYCTFNPQHYQFPNMKRIRSDDGSTDKNLIAPMRGPSDTREY